MRLFLLQLASRNLVIKQRNAFLKSSRVQSRTVTYYANGRGRGSSGCLYYFQISAFLFWHSVKNSKKLNLKFFASTLLQKAFEFSIFFVCYAEIQGIIISRTIDQQAECSSEEYVDTGTTKKEAFVR